jgi:hypothetical protein
MNEELEMIGVIGTEKFTKITQMWDGRQVHGNTSEERIVPMLFKNLPVGTQLFIKKVKE